MVSNIALPQGTAGKRMMPFFSTPMFASALVIPTTPRSIKGESNANTSFIKGALHAGNEDHTREFYAKARDHLGKVFDHTDYSVTQVWMPFLMRTNCWYGVELIVMAYIRPCIWWLYILYITRQTLKERPITWIYQQTFANSWRRIIGL